MITLTEEQFKEMIETAHRAGQHNQGHCDPSAYEAMVYYEREVKKLIISDVSGSTVNDKEHYDALMECCTKLLDIVDSGKVPQRQIIGLRILLNRK